MTSERDRIGHGYGKAARHPLQTHATPPDEIIVALVTAVCVLGLNAAFTILIHPTPPFLVSTAIPTYPFIAYLLTRPITRRGKLDAPVWSATIMIFSLLTLFFYAG